LTCPDRSTLSVCPETRLLLSIACITVDGPRKAFFSEEKNQKTFM
jgi:hypothetical protein